jgi:hypothetical protein
VPTTEEGEKTRITDNFGTGARPTDSGCNPSNLFSIPSS